LRNQFSELVATLEGQLARPLPGSSAHALLAPRPRRQWPDDFDPARVRHAAGLLLLFPVEQRAHLVLTVRAGTLGRHGGQVSLPGGVVEPGEAFDHAALREAHEEIGLAAADVRVIGALTPIDIPVSGFRLHPIVAAAGQRPEMHPSDGEVAEILEISLDELMAPRCLTAIERQRDDAVIVTPTFCVEDHQIWGATAMVLAEFLVVAGWRPDTA